MTVTHLISNRNVPFVPRGHRPTVIIIIINLWRICRRALLQTSIVAAILHIELDAILKGGLWWHWRSDWNLSMCILGNCTSLYYMVVNCCSLATDGVLAYVYPLHHPLLQPRWHFMFSFFCRRQNSAMKQIIISETPNCKTREWTDLFSGSFKR